MNIGPLNSSHVSPGYEGSGRPLPPGGSKFPPGISPIETPKFPTPLDTVSITNTTPHDNVTLNPDAKPMPLPRFDGPAQVTPGNPGTGGTLPKGDSDLKLDPDAEPTPLPYFDAGSQVSPGSPGTSGIPHNGHPGITFSPDGRPVPLPHYVPGSYVPGNLFNGVA